MTDTPNGSNAADYLIWDKNIDTAIEFTERYKQKDPYVWCEGEMSIREFKDKHPESDWQELYTIYSNRDDQLQNSMGENFTHDDWVGFCMIGDLFMAAASVRGGGDPDFTMQRWEDEQKKRRDEQSVPNGDIFNVIDHGVVELNADGQWEQLPRAELELMQQEMDKAREEWETECMEHEDRPTDDDCVIL